MTVVLAALDTTAAARPVLETAVRTAQLLGARVEAVHVRTNAQASIEVPQALAERCEVPFRLLDGPVAPALLGALEASEVVAAAVGARATPGGRRPVGRTAAHVLEHASKPVIIVPPEAVSPGPFRRLLVPLEGTETSSRPVLEWLSPLLTDDVELVVLHVFTDDTRPAMIDHPEYDWQILGGEFLARHFPLATHIQIRPGPVAARVAEVSNEHRADLIIMSWAQNAAPGRARILRAVVAASTIPILLLPSAPFEIKVPEAPADGTQTPVRG